MGEEDVDALAEAVEYWKQTRFYFGRLLQALAAEGVDREAFRDEFVDGPVDEQLMDVLDAVRDDHGQNT